MKKILCTLVILVMLSSYAMAAGTDEETSSGGLEDVTISWYYPGNYPQNDQDTVFDEFNRLLQEKINTTIDFKTIAWGDYNQKMQVIIASGEEYDLCYTANWINNYHHNVAKGAFVPLDDLLTEYAPGLWASVPEKIWNATRVKGNIYGLINYQISAMTSGVMFPKSLVEKYDFDYKSVTKLEDLEPYLQAVKDGEPGIMPLGVANTAGTTIGYVNAYLGFEEIGGRAVPGVILDNDPSMKVVNQFKTEKFKNWLYLMRDWYQKGFIAKDAIAITDLNPNLSGGAVGVSFEGNHKPGGDAEASARWGYEAVNVPISESLLITSSIISTMHSISITSQEPERAMMFMEVMNTDKAQYNLLTFGIKDTHYEMTGSNSIKPIADSGYYPSTAWMHASTFNAFLLPGQPDDVWEQTKTLNMSAKASPIIGFSFDPEPVKSEISQCTSVKQEYLPALELGTVDPDEVLPEFLDKLDRAGAQKIVDEMQSQIDAWKATN